MRWLRQETRCKVSQGQQKIHRKSIEKKEMKRETYLLFCSFSFFGRESLCQLLISLAMLRTTFFGRVPKFHLSENCSKFSCSRLSPSNSIIDVMVKKGRSRFKILQSRGPSFHLGAFKTLRWFGPLESSQRRPLDTKMFLFYID